MSSGSINGQRGRARSRDRQRREPGVSCRRDGPSMASTSPGPSSRLAGAAIRQRPGAWPGPRPRTFRSPMRRSTPAGRSAGSITISDHEAALREMRRVTRPGGPVVVADEVPGLHRAGLGHLLGIPSLDAWWLRKLGLDREFVDMVLAFDVDLKHSFAVSGPRPRGTGSGTGWVTVLSNTSTSSESYSTRGGLPCRPRARNTSRPRTGRPTGTSGAASSAEGALQYDPSLARAGLLGVRARGCRSTTIS